MYVLCIILVDKRARFILIGDIYKETSASSYQGSTDVVDVTKEVKKEYSYGVDILNKPWQELNGYSVIDRMNKDQRTFNSFVDESNDDPNEAWKWRGTRSMARNRTMAMHAHLTANYVVPMVFAQNESQESDRDMADTMRDILEWMTINSNYRPAFLMASMGMLVNPVTYMSVDYSEVHQKIKVKTDQGYTTKEVIDDVMSGFQVNVFSADQILITNAYEQNIQRQRSIIKRRYIEYSEAKEVYGDHDNWRYIQHGIKSIYNDEDGLFYDVKDSDHPYLVEEVTYYNRREDTQICFINGVYMGESDVEANPIKHRDEKYAPKYDVVPFGYERISEHFFYYKSLVNRVGWDNQLLDAMYEVTMNKSFLDMLPPIAITGDDKIDTQVVFPSAVAAFSNPETKVQPIIPTGSNAGFQAIQAIEASLSEASLSDVQLGQLPDASQKAYSVARAEQNAKILLSGAGKSLGQSVAAIGQLMIDIALHNLTTAQIDEITGGEKYRSFILDDQMVNGKKVSKNIIFDANLVGREMYEDEIEEFNLELLTKTGYPKNNSEIYLINPYLFSKMKYMVRVEPDMMIPKNESFEKALMSEVYSMFRNDPIINPEALVRRVAYAFFKGDTDDMIAEKSTDMMGASAPQTQMGAQAKSSALAPATQAPLAGMV